MPDTMTLIWFLIVLLGIVHCQEEVRDSDPYVPYAAKSAAGVISRHDHEDRVEKKVIQILEATKRERLSRYLGQAGTEYSLKLILTDTQCPLFDDDLRPPSQCAEAKPIRVSQRVSFPEVHA